MLYRSKRILHIKIYIYINYFNLNLNSDELKM